MEYMKKYVANMKEYEEIYRCTYWIWHFHIGSGTWENSELYPHMEKHETWNMIFIFWLVQEIFLYYNVVMAVIRSAPIGGGILKTMCRIQVSRFWFSIVLFVNNLSRRKQLYLGTWFEWEYAGKTNRSKSSHKMNRFTWKVVSWKAQVLKMKNMRLFSLTFERSWMDVRPCTGMYQFSRALLWNNTVPPSQLTRTIGSISHTTSLQDISTI